MYGYPLLQTLVCKADWQYHGRTILTVEYILLILLLQYSMFKSSMITTPVNSHQVGTMILYSVLLSAVFPSGQVDFQGDIWPKNVLALSRGSGGMLPRKILKILLLRLARIAFVASFPPIFFIKSFFKNFRNNSKCREKFNFSGSSVRKTIFRESHGSSGRLGRTVSESRIPPLWI